MKKIIIKNFEIRIEIPEKYFIEAKATSDGMVFHFKGGSHYYHTDPNIPIDTMENIANVVNKQFSQIKGDLEIDLKNYKRPTLINLH